MAQSLFDFLSVLGPNLDARNVIWHDYKEVKHSLWSYNSVSSREFEDAPVKNLRAVCFQQGGKDNGRWGGRRVTGWVGAVCTKVVMVVMWRGRKKVKGEKMAREEGKGEEEEQQN